MRRKTCSLTVRVTASLCVFFVSFFGNVCGHHSQCFTATLEDAERTISSLRSVNKLLEDRLKKTSPSPTPSLPPAAALVMEHENERKTLVSSNEELSTKNSSLLSVNKLMQQRLEKTQGLLEAALAKEKELSQKDSFYLGVEVQNQKLQEELEHTRKELWAKEKLVLAQREELEEAQEAAERLRSAPGSSKKQSQTASTAKVSEVEAKLKAALAEVGMLRSGIEAKDKMYEEHKKEDAKTIEQLRVVNRALEVRVQEGKDAGAHEKSLQAQLAAANAKIREIEAGPLKALELSEAAAKSDAANARKQVAALELNMADLNKENAALKAETRKLVAAEEDKANQAKKLAVQVQELQELNKSQSERYAQLKIEAAEVEKSKDRLEKDVRAHFASVVALEKRIVDKDAKLDEQSEAMEKDAKTIAQLRELDKAQIQRLASMKEEAESDKAARNADMESGLNARIKKLEGALQAAQDGMEAKDKELQSRHETIGQLRELNKAQTQRLRDKQGEVERLEADLQSVKTAQQRVEMSREEQTALVVELEKKLSNAAATAKDAGKSREELEASVARLAEENKQLRANVAAASLEQERALRLEKEVQSKSSSQNDLKIALDKANAEAQKLVLEKESLANASKRAAHVQKAAEQLSAELATERDKNAKLQESLAQESKKAAQLLSLNQMQIARLRDVQVSLDESVSVASHLKEQAKANGAEMDRLAGETNSWKMRSAELEREKAAEVERLVATANSRASTIAQVEERALSMEKELSSKKLLEEELVAEKEKIAELRVALEQETKKVHELQSSSKMQADWMKEVQEDAKAKSAEVESLRGQLAGARDVLERSAAVKGVEGAESERLQKRVAELEAELESESKKAKQLQSLNTMQTDRLRSLKEEAEKAKESSVVFASRVTELEVELNVARASADVAKAEKSHVERQSAEEIAALKRSHNEALARREGEFSSAAKADSAKLREKLDETEMQLARVNADLDAETKKVHELQSSSKMQADWMKEVQEDAKAKSAEVESLRGQLAGARDVLERSAAVKGVEGAESERLQKRVAELEAELESESKKAKQLQSLNTMQTDRLRSLKEEAEKAKESDGILQSERSSFSARISELELALTMAHSNLDSAKADKIRAERELVEKTETWKRDHNELLARREVESSTAAKIEAADLRKQLEDTEARLVKAKADNNFLSDKLAAFPLKQASLEEEIVRLKGELRDASRKMRQMQSELEEATSKLRTVEAIAADSKARAREERGRSRALDMQTTSLELQTVSTSQAKARVAAARAMHARHVDLRHSLWGEDAPILSAAEMHQIHVQQARELHAALGEVAAAVGDDTVVTIALLEGQNGAPQEGARTTGAAPSTESRLHAAQLEKIALQQRVKTLESELSESKSAVTGESISKIEAQRLLAVEKSRVEFLEKRLKVGLLLLFFCWRF